MKDGSEAKVVVDHSTEIPKPGTVWSQTVGYYHLIPDLKENLGNSSERE